MFLRLRKLGNICCGHKMFLNKIRNIFCVPYTICIRNKCCAREQTGKHLCRKQCVSATMYPHLLGPLGSFVLAMDCVLTTAPRIHQLYFITFPDIVKLYTCQLIYDHLINKKSSNLNLSLVSKQHNYATRSASLQHLNPESFRINIRKFCPPILGCYYCRMIFLYIYATSQLENYFKKALYQFYFARY